MDDDVPTTLDSARAEIQEFLWAEAGQNLPLVGLVLVARSIDRLTNQVEELTKTVISIRNGPLNL